MKLATSLCLLLSFLFFLSSVCLARSSNVEVLYVEEHGISSSRAVLRTYNVDPETATANLAGPALHVPVTFVDPLRVRDKHLIYLWNGTDVWKYDTDTRGVPAAQPAQHLAFGFEQPVVSFVADPRGRFAYAGLSWCSSVNQIQVCNAEIVLFTIDQANGDLVRTGRVVNTFTDYFPLANFLFGSSGRRLYSYEATSGAPESCGGDYYFYDVNRNTGSLGPMTYLVGFGACGDFYGLAFTDTLTALASNPGGAGEGSIVIRRTGSGDTITCGSSMLAFCGDAPSGLAIDPANQNIFFTDWYTGQISVGHMDFRTQELLPTTSSIPPSSLFFSPDSRLIYGVSATGIDIYAYDAQVGDITASSVVPKRASDTIVATATLANN